MVVLVSCGPIRGFVNFYNHGFAPKSTIVLYSNNGKPNSLDELEKLFDSIKDIDPSDVSPDVREAILNKIEESKPSELEIRMNILGFTPLTVVGFGIAAVMISLNTVLGSGWAADLLGIQTGPTITVDSNSNSRPSKLDNTANSVMTVQLNRPENLLRWTMIGIGVILSV